MLGLGFKCCLHAHVEFMAQFRFAHSLRAAGVQAWVSRHIARLGVSALGSDFGEGGNSSFSPCVLKP